MNITPKQLRKAGFIEVNGKAVRGKKKTRRTSSPAKMVDLASNIWIGKGGVPVVTITVPLMVVSEPNQRDRWEQIKRKKMQRRMIATVLFIYKDDIGRHPPSNVEMTRLGVKELDKDNLAGAFKAVQDEIARYFGVDDKPGGPIEFTHAQRVGNVTGIELEFRWSKL